MALQAGLCFNVFYMWAYYTGLLISLFLVYLFLYLFYTVSAYIPFYFIQVSVQFSFIILYIVYTVTSLFGPRVYLAFA